MFKDLVIKVVKTKTKKELKKAVGFVLDLGIPKENRQKNEFEDTLKAIDNTYVKATEKLRGWEN